MEKLGMSFGGGPSRKELQDTIESHKKQLVQYQTRFKDVVQAYKSLLKEKEALEASLKALTVSHDVDQTQQGDDTAAVLSEAHCLLRSEDSLDKPVDLVQDQGEAGGPTSFEASGYESSEVDRRLLQLRSKLSTLTSALATVTQEKSRMEANFQADKRQLKQELEELQGRLVALTTKQEAELHSLTQQLAESRARVIMQQHEREQEQGDQLTQLRELQRILQQERELRQDAELRLQDANTALLVTSQAMERGAESEAHLHMAQEERDELRRRLQALEEDHPKPDSRIQQLQQELTELKNHFHQQIHNETHKVCEAEERARERAQAAEFRVAALEQRLSELSDLLGSCEKTRQRDQQVAQRLRERILQLDMENKTLATATSSGLTSDLGQEETQLDIAVLKEKMEKLKKLLLLAAQRNPDQAQNIQKLSETEVAPDGNNTSVLVYQQELRQLKDEFERYKLRAQVVLKNKNAKDGSQAKELEETRDQLSELKEKYINLRIESDEAEARHRHQLEEQQQHMVALQHSQRQEVERLETSHRDKWLQLEAELHKQRERSMALLDEKDKELEQLRAAALSCSHTEKMADEGAAEESKGDVVSQALRWATPTEPTLLLYAEQLARKEVEVSALRRQKHRLEDDLHQMQAKLIAHKERHDEDVSDLRSQLDKLVQDQSREGANMEYLKNIIYRFLTLQDASGRQQTLTAILTILHFSPQEKHTVMRLQGATWWSSRKR